MGDVIRLTRGQKEETDKRDEGAEGFYSHWMFVVHDREELIDRKHLGQGVGPEELPGPL